MAKNDKKSDKLKGIEIIKDANGRVVRYKFRCCIGRDEQYKQIWRTMTISADDSRISGLTPAKLENALFSLKREWDEQQKAEYDRSHSKEDKTKMRFDTFVKTVWWVDHVMNGKHSSTTISFYQNMSDDLIEYFGRKKLSSFVAEDIKRYTNYLNKTARTKTGEELSDTTKVRHYQTLRNILNYAMRFGYMDMNNDPCKLLTADDIPQNKSKKIDFLTPEQAGRFMSALDSEPIFWKTMLTIMVYTGIRRGEALGIKWEDIDYKKHSISIHRNITIDKNSDQKYAEKEPKTEESIRDVPITPYIEELLTLLKKDREEKYNNTLIPLTAFVFSRENDPYKPIYPTEPTRFVRKFIERHNLPNVSPHDLRHTAATIALESGADLNQVQKLLGHKDPTTTMSFYAGVTDEGKRRAVDGIENIIKEEQKKRKKA